MGIENGARRGRGIARRGIGKGHVEDGYGEEGEYREDGVLRMGHGGEVSVERMGY